METEHLYNWPPTAYPAPTRRHFEWQFQRKKDLLGRKVGVGLDHENLP